MGAQSQEQIGCQIHKETAEFFPKQPEYSQRNEETGTNHRPNTVPAMRGTNDPQKEKMSSAPPNKRGRFSEVSVAVPAPTPSPVPWTEFSKLVLTRNMLAGLVDSPLFAKTVTGWFVAVSGKNLHSSFEPDLLLCKICGLGPSSSEEYVISTEGGDVKSRLKFELEFVPLRGKSVQRGVFRLAVASNQSIPPAEYARFCEKMPQNVLAMTGVLRLLDARDRLNAVLTSGRCTSVLSDDGSLQDWGRSGCGHSASLLLRSWRNGPTVPIGSSVNAVLAPAAPARIHSIDIEANDDLQKVLKAWPALGANTSRDSETHMAKLVVPCLADGSSADEKISGEYVFLFVVSCPVCA